MCIEKARFHYPDQPPPRHGGKSWVRLALLPPANWMTVRDEAGLFFTVAGNADWQAFGRLRAEAAVLESERGPRLRFERLSEQPFEGRIGVYRALAKGDPVSEFELLAWVAAAANALVNAFRPGLAGFAREA